MVNWKLMISNSHVKSLEIWVNYAPCPYGSKGAYVHIKSMSIQCKLLWNLHVDKLHLKQ
jgi:hypothetical protein